jgi:hypothetical protein
VTSSVKTQTPPTTSMCPFHWTINPVESGVSTADVYGWWSPQSSQVNRASCRPCPWWVADNDSHEPGPLPHPLHVWEKEIRMSNIALAPYFTQQCHLRPHLDFKLSAEPPNCSNEVTTCQLPLRNYGPGGSVLSDHFGGAAATTGLNASTTLNSITWCCTSHSHKFQLTNCLSLFDSS